MGSISFSAATNKGVAMKTRIALLVFVMSAVFGFCDPPTKTYDIDFSVAESQYIIQTKIQNTPRLVFNMKEEDVAYDGTGYTNILRYARNRDELAMASITGVVSTTQAIFDTDSGAFPHEMDDWYCVMMLVKGDKTYSYAEGSLQVDTGNEATAPAALVRTYAINGDDYDPFTGSFSHWPFVTTGLVSYVYTDDSWQSGTSTNAGTNTTVTFPSAYTNIPIVQCEINGEDIAFLSEASPIETTLSNFTYTIGSAAGAVTNAWRVYWQATPASGHGVTGYTDAQAISAVSDVLGTAAFTDIGNTVTSDVPNWGMVQSAITNFGSGDVFASSNNTYSLNTTQAMDVATANLFSLSETNTAVNGGFDTDSDWTYDTEWAIGGGLALHEWPNLVPACWSNAIYNIAEIYQSNTTIIAGHTYRVSVDVVIATSGLPLVRARIGDSYGAFINTTGSYIQDITAVTEADDTMGFECIAIATADTLVSLDNVTMVDLSRTITIDNGAVDIGGETVTREKIVIWDAKIGSVDTNGIMGTASNLFYQISNPSNYVTQTVTNGLASTGYVNNAVSSLGSGDVYTTSNNTFSAGTSQAFADATFDNATVTGMLSSASSNALEGASWSGAAAWLEFGENENGLTAACFNPEGANDAATTTVSVISGRTYNGSMELLHHGGAGGIFYISAGGVEVGGSLVFATPNFTASYAFSYTATNTTTVPFVIRYDHTGGVGSLTITEIQLSDSSGPVVWWNGIAHYGTSEWDKYKIAEFDKLTGSGYFNDLYALLHTGADGGLHALPNSVAGLWLRANGIGVAPSWDSLPDATVTNVSLSDLTDVISTNYFLVGDGANAATQSLAATKIILGIGDTTNTTFASMTMTGDTNEVIYQNGSVWTNGNIITVLIAEQTVTGGKVVNLNADKVDGIEGAVIITTSSSVGDVSDVSLAGIGVGQVLKWDGSDLVASNDNCTAVDTNAIMGEASNLFYTVENTNSYVDQTVTNGLASIVYVTNAIFDATNAIAGDWQADIGVSNGVQWTATTQLVNDTSNVLNTAIGDLATEVTNNTSAILQSALLLQENVISLSGLDAAVIKKDGSVTWTGDDNHGGKLIENVGDPDSGDDAFDRDYGDARYLELDGTGAMAANLNMGGFSITNVSATSIEIGTSTVSQASINRWNQTADGVFTGDVSIAGDLTVDGDLSITGTLTCAGINLNGTTITNWSTNPDSPLPAGETRINLYYSPSGTYRDGTITVMAWNNAECDGQTVFAQEFETDDLRFNPTFDITNTALMVGSTYWFVWMDTDGDGMFNYMDGTTWASLGNMDEPAAYGQFMPYALADQNNGGTIDFWMIEKKGSTPRFGLAYDQIGESFDITIRDLTAGSWARLQYVAAHGNAKTANTYVIEPAFIEGDHQTASSFGGWGQCSIGSTGKATLELITNAVVLGNFEYGRTKGIEPASGDAPSVYYPVSTQAVASSTITFKFTDQYTDYSAMELVIDEGSEGGAEVYSYTGYMENEHYDDGTTWHKATVSGMTAGSNYYWRVKNRFGTSCGNYPDTSWSDYGSFTYSP